ncbi:MAG: CotH kinase family protein [Lachnospiraceae bacterium]|nr:CotH kinase family protein [Lachnospiraceae bacterium]
MKHSFWFSVLFLIMLFSFPASAAADDEVEEPLTAADTAVFTCTRNNGDVFHSFKSEDGTHVLFLPADFNTADLTVTCISDVKIKTASCGTMNPGSGTIRGNLKGRSVSVTFADGSEASLLAESSSLPSMAITLYDSTLDDVHEDKDAKHTVALTTVYDPKNADHDLAVSGGEFKGRGNSSWVYYDKKGYQLKLSEETSVLGMPAAKKWTLLAGASDSTLVRTKLALDAAASLPFLFTPKAEYADLWINGDYRGLYLITEKAEIGADRLALTSGHGVLAEFDNAFYSDEDYWFEDDSEQFFSLKDAQGDDPEADFKVFEDKVNALIRALRADNWTSVSGLIDEESFACALLVNEYFANRESATTSFYWYMDGESGDLCAGPVWDFDTCMAVEDVPTAYYVFQNPYYLQLVDFDEFEDILQRVYAEYGPALKNTAAAQKALQLEIASSAAVNFMRYDTLGTVDAKSHYFLETWEENMAEQYEWLSERAEHFSVGAFCAKRRPVYLETRISEGNRFADLYFRGKGSFSGIIFKVKAEKLADDEPKEYTAEQDEYGRWYARVDLLDFSADGLYNVEVCSTRSSTPLTERSFSLSYIPAMDYTRYGINYRAVFNPVYYMERYPEVAAVCHSDPRVLLRHFIEYGMKEGRQGSLLFDPEYYIETYPDLAEHYGTSDLTQFYIHYCQSGRAEGRIGSEAFE